MEEKEKENKISETEQKKSRMIQEQTEEKKDEKEAKSYAGMRGDVLVSPSYEKMFLLMLVPFLIIFLIYKLIGMQ